MHLNLVNGLVIFSIFFPPPWTQKREDDTPESNSDIDALGAKFVAFWSLNRNNKDISKTNVYFQNLHSFHSHPSSMYSYVQ